jgi:hypothetical protein
MTSTMYAMAATILVVGLVIAFLCFREATRLFVAEQRDIRMIRRKALARAVAWEMRNFDREARAILQHEDRGNR